MRVARVAVLHVGHVDVDDAVQQPQRLDAVVAAGVVDERQPQPLPAGDLHRGYDLRDDVAGRHEVDVVAALFLQCEHDVGDRRWFDLASLTLLREIPVLAVDAAQVAPAEEDRPGAAPAAQHIFLAVVWPPARDDRALAGAADRALDARPPVHMAVPGTQIAVLEVTPCRLDPPREHARLQQVDVGCVQFAVSDCGEDGGKVEHFSPSRLFQSRGAAVLRLPSARIAVAVRNRLHSGAGTRQEESTRLGRSPAALHGAD